MSRPVGSELAAIGPPGMVLIGAAGAAVSNRGRPEFRRTTVGSAVVLNLDFA